MTRIVATTITGHSYSWFINNSKFPLLLQSTKLLISKRCSFNIVKVQKRVTMYDVDLIRWIQNKMKLTWKLAKIVGAQRRIKNPFKHLQLFLQSKFHCRCLTGFWICLSYSLSSPRTMRDTEQWKKSSEMY